MQMKTRFVSGLLRVFVVTAVLLSAGPSWAIFDKLEPSPDDYGMKYTVDIQAAGGDLVTVTFTLEDEGRLKPFYSVTVMAFSLQTDSQGGRTYDVKAPLQLKPTADGKRAGQVQIRRQFLDRAMIRVLTQSVDGRRTKSNAAYYDLSLRRFLNNVPAAASNRAPATIAAPPTPPKVVK
jgi:hypothetical protein